MHITCTQENLRKSLGLVGRVVGNRVSLPVLANVLLQTEGGRVRLSATDLEIGITTYIGAKVDSEGAITVPSRTLVEFVSALGEGTVELTGKGASLEVSAGSTRATLRGIEAEEFPVIPVVDAKQSITIPGVAFAQSLKQVAIAVAPDDTRPVLAGVLVRLHNDQLICAATDGYRLAEKRIRLDEPVKESKEAILPARSVNELIRVLSALTPDKVEVAIQDNQMLFAFADTEFVSRIIDGKYVDYEKIIPTTTTTTAILDADQFKIMLKTATIFAREAANTIKVRFGPSNEVVLSALAESVGDATTQVPAEIDGKEAIMSFNVRYISDALSVIADEKVEFALSGELLPGLIRGTTSPDYRYIIMPLKAT